MRRQVLIREVCSACGGTGYISHPAWELYWEGHSALLEERALRAWFSQEGYDEPPPEEVPCPECDGQGYVMRWVGIREVRHA